jgi:hypothetical protein
MIEQSLSQKRTHILKEYFQAMDDLRTLKMEFAAIREHSSEEQIAYNNALNDLKKKVQDFQFELTQVRLLIDQQKERRPRFKPPSQKPDDRSFQEAKRKLENLYNKK